MSHDPSLRERLKANQDDCQMLNPSAAETRIFQRNKVKTMAANALTPCHQDISRHGEEHVGYAGLKDHSGYGLRKWGMSLQCNIISYWLSPYPEWSLRSFSSRRKDFNYLSHPCAKKSQKLNIYRYNKSACKELKGKSRLSQIRNCVISNSYALNVSLWYRSLNSYVTEQARYLS